MIKRTIVGAVAASLLGLAGAEAASAATVDSNLTFVSYYADNATTNNVTLSYVGGKAIVKDAGVASLTPGTNCVQGTAANIVSCSVSAGQKYFDVETYDGNDAINVETSAGAFRNFLKGGTGGDTINGGNSPDYIRGEDGADTINGRGGDDSLGGGADDDRLIGSTGADDVSGDAGTDEFSYNDGRTAGITVVLNSGLSGNSSDYGGLAGDTLTGFENIIGTPGSDSITGTAARNWINGGGGTGADSITALGGNDEVQSFGPGSTIQLGDGDDEVYGVNSATVADSISCGNGND
ncbi:MAG: calcium-binding protein, partial [Solirubrobacteraceae bacterium]|nr:calcium-binding protein [Solirubrobacteraceae bacterium]